MACLSGPVEKVRSIGREARLATPACLGKREPMKAVAVPTQPNTHCISEYRGSHWVYLDTFIDCFFVTDLILNFFTPLMLDGQKVTHCRAIAKHYLCHGLGFDLLCTFPYTVFILGLPDHALQVGGYAFTFLLCHARVQQLLKPLTVFCFRVQRQDRVVYPWGLTRLTWIDLRWTLLLRVLRFGKAKQCLQQIEHYIPNYKTASCVLRLLQLLIILFLLGNLFGCLWFYSAAMTPRGSFQYTETWVEQKDLSRTGETGLTPIQQWMAALYWAFTTLTTTGYGDISANTQSEHLLVIAATLIGVTCNAIIIGQMGVLVVEMSETATTQRRHLKNLNTFCTIHRLPKSLRSRLHETHSVVMARMHAQTDMDGRKLLRFVPPAVRREVFMHVHRRIITTVPILKFNSLALQHFIAPLLQPAIYLSGEYISYIGEPSQSVCFVLSGEVAIIDSNGFITHLLEAGGFLGEKSVLSGAPMETSARAIHDMSECYHIDREDTKKVLRCFPEFRKTLELAGCLRSATTCLKKRGTQDSKKRLPTKPAISNDEQDDPNASNRFIS